METTTTDLSLLIERLEHAIDRLERLERCHVQKDWYTIGEVAERTGRKPFTIRQLCNYGAIQAEKDGREWRVAATTVENLLRTGVPKIPRPVTMRKAA